MTIQTRQAKPLSTRAAVGSVDQAARTVEVVWTTGAKVLRSSWFDGPHYEELSLDPAHVRLGRLNNGAPFLANHDSYDVARQLGVVESARLEAGKGIATVRFAKAEDDPEADKVFRKIADGIIQNVSVGYRTWKVEKLESVDEKIPTLRAVDWEPYEISAVATGADDGAGFRSAAESNEVQIHTPTPSSSERRPMDPEKMKQEQEAAQAARAAELNTAREAAQREERERISGITSAVRAARLAPEFGAKLIAEGSSLESARGLVLEELAKRDAELPTENHVRVQVTDDAADKFQRGASALLFTRGVAADVIKRAKAAGVAGFDKLETDPGEFRGMSLVDLARESLERRGIKTRGMDHMTLVGRALTQRSGGGGYAATGDFSVLFENVMHKVLLGSYATTPDTWSRFCKQEELSDFRTHNRFSVGALGSLDAVNENGEFKNKSIPDGQKKTLSVGTKGNIYAISRQAIINDDMGALANLMAAAGRGARLGVEEDVYALLALNGGLGPTQADAQPFFHSANRGNVNGTGSALTVAGIDADRVVMLAMRDQNTREYLQMTPSILLVSSANGAAARAVNSDTFDHDSSKLQKANSVRGLFSDVIDTPRFTGNRRYLFADPSVAAAIVVTFLEGQGRAPVLESQDGWRVDGTELKLRFDYRAQMFDPKGAITNAGQ